MTMTHTRTRRRFNVDEYERLGEIGILHEDEHIELIYGDIREMYPDSYERALPNGLVPRLFTVDEYEQMIAAGILTEDERLELIEGEIVTMSPIGRSHVLCVIQLTDLIPAQIGHMSVISVQNPIRLPDLSEPQPDLAVLRRPASRYAQRLPEPADILLLIEVGDSTVADDRALKVPLYAQAGIAEVWLIDLPGAAIEIYSGLSAGAYQTRLLARRGDTFTSPTVPGLALRVADVIG